MGNQNYWKDRYGHAWEKSEVRERAVIDRVKRETGLDIVPVGLGAGSSDYLSGSASSQGYERGGADLQVVGTSVFLEVTGPQSNRIGPEAPLWVRPDKIRAARAHWPAQRVFVVHWLEQDGRLRVIPLDDDLFDAVESGRLSTVFPTIRGTRETYIDIPANSEFVHPWSWLVAYLKTLDPSVEH